VILWLRMKNITVSVSEDVYRAARMWAAEHDTSVSALVGEAQQRRIQAEIQSFSAGRHPGREEVHERAVR
jgi:hypothetical protein